MVEKRWRISASRTGRQCLASVQKRNIEALNEILTAHRDENIVIGTHGTALSTIINYYDPGFNCDGFKRIWFWMPYIVRLDFSGTGYIDRRNFWQLNGDTTIRPDVLSELTDNFAIWETVYYHVMKSHNDILEWYRSTGLRPYLNVLDEEKRADFEHDILDRIKENYTVQKNGKVIFRFPRLFFTAYSE